jgi:molybdopterin molybdotransferase
MKLQEIASCIAGYDPDALPVAQARDVIARALQPVQEFETVALRDGLQRVLAADIVSPIDVPAHDNAAMDGYALRGSELRADAPSVFVLAGTGLAGALPLDDVAAGHCVRIMTGAVMPRGLDTVLPQELASVEGNRVTVPAGALKPGEHRRLAGEDLARGAPALRAGRLLRPADLGVLASLGRAELPVRRRLRVAFFSTGNELRSLGEPLDAGCVYDSNRYTIAAMLARLNVEPIDLGVVRDDPAALEAAFAEAARRADAIVTSGGVSVGEADHTKRVMAQLGDTLFWKIAMRPGRPMAFGRIRAQRQGGIDDGAEGKIGDAMLFGLPGNPVAVMVTFYAFVREALLRLAGASVEPLPMLRARSSAALRKKPGRTEYQRGIVSRGADGDWEVAITGAQGSGILSSMSAANAFVVLAHEQGNVAAGEFVDVLLFDGLV